MNIDPNERLKAIMHKENNLEQWWMDNAQNGYQRTMPKVAEYGANDLVHIGQTLARCMDWNCTQQQAAEIGVWFYLQGKIARAFEAIERRELPSDDTAFDIKIYATMIERIRENGTL
jgi:hypothetical protein